MEKSYLERRSLYWNGAHYGGHLHSHYFGVIWSWLSFIPLIFRVRAVTIVSTPNHQIHCGFHCYRHDFSRSPCTVLTADKLLAVRAVQWNCQWPLAMGGNSHQSREPTIHCDWGNSNQYLDQPITLIFQLRHTDLSRILGCHYGNHNHGHQAPLLLVCFNFNPNMDK